MDWTVRRSNPGRGEIFCTRPGRHWSPPAFYKMGIGSLARGAKRLERGVDQPPHLTPRLKKEKSSPSGPSWPVLGWNLPLPTFEFPHLKKYLFIWVLIVKFLCYIFTNILAGLYSNINFRNVNVITSPHLTSSQTTSSAVTFRLGTASYPTAVCVTRGSHSECAGRVDVRHEGAINCRHIFAAVIASCVFCLLNAWNFEVSKNLKFCKIMSFYITEKI